MTDRASVRHGYFVLQVSASCEGDVHALKGVLEDLTTGEKLGFESAADLTRTVEAWAGDPKLPVPPAALSVSLKPGAEE